MMMPLCLNISKVLPEDFLSAQLEQNFLMSFFDL